MSPTLTTFLFELANFLLLVALIGWLLFKPVRAALEGRQAAEQRRRAELEAQEKALTEGRAQLEAHRAAFDEETARLRQERLTGAETEAAAIVARARQTADLERDRSERRLTHLERAQVERLAAAVAAAVRDAVARLLTTLRAPELDQALLRAACRELAEGAHPPGPIVVESATPLEETARAAIRTAAGSRAASIEFQVVPELGSGLRVTTAGGMIDASAAGIAAHAERVVVETLSHSETGARP